MVLQVPGLYGPRQPLPLLVRPLPGESTGSFVNRLAHANGLRLADFLARVGQGTGSSSGDVARVERYPQCTEMYVNGPGLEYLAVLAGEPVAVLQQALPALAPRYRLRGDGEAVWKWPWQPSEGCLVRYCTRCAEVRGVREPAWWLASDSWRVCARHWRWCDDSRTEPLDGLSLKELPEVVTAHLERARLQKQFGRAGEELFADAFQVAAGWWRSMPMVLRWVHRAWACGLEDRSSRVMPLVVYPEAARLAQLMAEFEQSDVRDTDARSRWLGQVEALMESWELDVQAGREPLLDWLHRHRTPAGTEAQPAARPGRGGLPLSPGHDRLASPTGSVEQRSCLS
ncbi:TniQ family protein [Streptomyces sp. NPDC059446]|uniref:TniQ family protein n=1 Tax=Streptomyces sp. NPDC059446 TaxID=3346833 RepID=UPI003684C7F1